MRVELQERVGLERCTAELGRGRDLSPMEAEAELNAVLAARNDEDGFNGEMPAVR